ncbi:MAG: AI-2E family transporter [Phycisphaeraceae bacterium]|nr:AI-2E family transporter [Phycisphaeraceae bacterium]MBX3405510.1 AI-2E family transporter [Phycisphaeraceae bacterium]
MSGTRRDSDAQRAGAGPDWSRLRLWQIQPIRDALVVLAVVGIVYLGYVCRVVTVPMLLALALAYLFEPLVARATGRFKWMSRQGAAVAIIVLGGALVVVPVTIGAGFAVVQGVTLVSAVASNTGNLIASVQGETAEERRAARARLPRSLRDVGEWLIDLRSEVEVHRIQKERRREAEAQRQMRERAAAEELAGGEAGDAQAEPEPPLPEVAEIAAWKEQLYQGLDWSIVWLRNNAETLAKNAGRQALGTGAQALGALASGVQRVGFLLFTGLLTAFFFFFFCTGYGRVLEFWEGLIPERKRGRVIDLVRQMDRVIAGFVRGRITICAILAVYMTVAYWFIGTPMPLVLGPVIGLLFIVPFVHVIGVPVAIVLMAIEPSGAAWQQQWWWIVFAPVGVYLGAQMLDDYILSPTIQGKATGMDTPTILFASFAGGALAGVYGLLLAIPVAACIKILLKEVFWPKFRAWGQGTERDFLPIGRE